MKPGEQALVDRVTSMAQTYQSLMYRRHGEWYVNMAHYAGFQWCYWDEENQQVVEPPRRNAYDVRLPIPLLTGAIMRVVSQIIRAPRRWVGIPLSSSEAHLQAATGIQRLLNHYWEFGGLQRLCREEILVAACLAETGWLRITWDPRGGEHRKMLVPLDPPSVERTTDAEIPDNVVPLFQEQVNQLPELRYEESVEPIGDLAVRAVSPFDVVCDPYARRPEQMRWWMEQYWKPRDDVQRKYGKRLQAEHASETTTGFSERILAGIKEAAGTLLALGGLAGSGDRQKSLGLEADDVVLERTFWTAPTDRHPEGRKIVVVNNRLMEAVDNPYGCIPAVPYGCFPIPGSPRKVALASLVRSLQLAINRLNSQDIQNVVLHSRMPWLNPKGC
ncbi:MAG: hypothetical protein FJ125_17580, partial [Deltaproteobacteria bacterium]|nr:hypothetical protein [Deltaproteobacteria bacterium]